MNFTGGIGEECSQGSLVQGGENDAGYGEPQGDFPDGAYADRETDPFEKAF